MPEALPEGVGDDSWKLELATLIAAALIWRPFRTYPRHRWKGADSAVCDIGLPSVFHDVLTPAFAKFAVLKLGARAVGRIQTRTVGLSVQAAGDAVQLAIADDPNIERLAASGADGVGGSAGSLDQAPGSSPGEWAKEHASFVQNGLGWLSVRAPSSRCQLLLLRNLLFVLQKVLNRHRKAWEAEQRALCAKLHKEGVGNGAIGRDFRILVAARGAEDSKALHRLNLLLFVKDLWKLMPAEGLTTEVCAIGLRMICSAGALLEKLQAGPHSRPPFKIFLLLGGAGPETISRIRPCMMDKWSRRFIAENPDLAAPSTLMKLYFTALLVALDSHAVECGHAWVRRLVHRRVQTWKSLFDDTAAAWQVKRMCEDGDGNNRKRLKTEDVAPKAKPLGPPRPRSGGNWRAFQRSQGTSDMKALAQVYDPSNLSEDARRQGEEARQRGLQGHTGNTLGPKAREVRRRELRERIVELATAAPDADSAHGALERFVTHALDFGLHVRDIASGARLQSTLARKKERLELERNAADIASFVEQATPTNLATLRSMAQGIDGLSHGMVAVPAVGCKILEMLPSLCARDAADVKAWMATAAARFSKLSCTVDKVWSHSCRLLPPAEKPDESSSEEESECWRFGFCVCSKNGSQVRQLRNSFLRCLKEAFPKSEEDLRERLLQGLIVVKLTPAPGADEDDHEELALAWGLEPMYVHISDKPWPTAPREKSS